MRHEVKGCLLAKSRLFRAVLAVLLVLECTFAVAQTSDSIKRDNGYIWGEGYGENADSKALESLYRELVHTAGLSCPTDRRLEVIKTYSGDIKRLSTRTSAGGTILRYMLKSDIPAIFESRMRKVKELVQSASGTVGNDALKLCYYHWAQTYLLSLPHSDQAGLVEVVHGIDRLRGVLPAYPSQLRHIASECSAIDKALGRLQPGQTGESDFRQHRDEKIAATEKAVSDSKPIERKEVTSKEVVGTETGVHKQDALPRIIDINPIIAHGLPAPFLYSDTDSIQKISVKMQTGNTSTKPAADKLPRGNGHRYFVMYSGAIGNPMLYGLTTAWRPKRFGGYISARKSFGSISYSGEFDSSAESATDNMIPESGSPTPGSSAFFNGKTARSGVTATVGAIYSPIPKWLDICIGCGYGQDNVFWETSGDNPVWTKITDRSHKGLALEAGFIVTIPVSSTIGCSIGIGAASIALSTPLPVLSAGISF